MVWLPHGVLASLNWCLLKGPSMCEGEWCLLEGPSMCEGKGPSMCEGKERIVSFISDQGN